MPGHISKVFTRFVALRKWFHTKTWLDDLVRIRKFLQGEGPSRPRWWPTLVLEELEPKWVPTPIQFFYIPMPEASVRTAFSQIVTSGTLPGNDMTSFVNIAATESETILTYDQWEDGYETNIETPIQSTTQIWGDGNLANGAWPGAPAGTDPAITAGQVIRLRNDIPTNPRVPANIFFDGGDKIGANKTVSISRAQFPVTPGSVIGSAVEVRDIRFYGTSYTAPVGTNTANAGSMYTFVQFFVQASQDNTIVQIDRDNNGVFEQTVVLNQGQTITSANNVLQGGRVVANKPVQTQLLTGHIGGQYASRSYTLFADSQLTNNYFTPVGQVNATYPVAIYVFNPNATAINVSTETRDNTGLVISTPVSVPAGSSVRFTAPTPPTGQITGMRVFSPNGENFAAVGAADAGSTTYDWAFSLQPVNSLSQLALVALGVGNSFNPPSASPPPPSGQPNSSPIWATVLADTTLYVDYDGNPATGANIDAFGNRYDASFSLQRLQTIQLRDTSDNDNSGMRLYTVDGTLISTAWGEDANTAPTGAPGFDAGTTVPAVPVPEFYKFADFAPPNGDANGDGYYNSGDTVRYTLRIRHIGTTPISNVLITDALPPEATYVPGTSFVDFGAGNVAIPDNGTTAFPLDEAGFNIANLDAGTTTFITFNVTINSGLPVGTTEMTNTALLAFDIFRLPAIKTLQLRTAVGDRIWHDMNGNGAQDAGEPGIPNVGLTLVWFGPDGTLGGGDDVTYTRTTDANGIYRFTDLPSGNFSLTVNTAGLPDNFTQTYDLDGTGTANTILFTQNAAQARTDADFGYNGNSTIGDLVWYDVNANGVRETGIVTEPVIPGATVTLTFGGDDGDLSTTIDNITYTTTSNASGLYSFTGLFGGDFNGANPNYRVTVTPPAAYTAAVYDATAPLTDATSTLQLAANATNNLQDFGFRGTAALGNFVWRDDNGNGVQNTGEPGIDGVSVQLLDAGGTVIAQTTTAGGGLYSFPGLIAGDYSIRFGNSNGTITFVRTARDASVNDAIDSDADQTTGQTGTYTLNAGQTNNTVAQGLYQLASLGDRIWFDINGNGTQDGGEPGINGVTVLLDYAGLDGAFSTGDDQLSVATQVTAVNGNYTFSNLAPGTYRARVSTATLPVGFNAPTFDLDGTGTANQATFTLVSNQNRTDVDFGYRGTGIIGDRVWHDTNANGTQDAGEPGIPNVSLTITWLGFDGVAGGGDDIAYAATTDANGLYSVSNLPGGNFTVAVVTASLPDNFTPTFDLDGTPTPNTTARSLLAGTNASDVDFGYRGNASIGDRVWFDVDGDGVQDNTLGDGFEPGIPGVTVTLLFGGDDGDLTTTIDNITYTTVTGADGIYTFANLFGGDISGANPNYRVTVTPLAGYPVQSFDSTAPTNDNTSTLQLANGGTNTAQDFGYRGPATQGIGNFVWNDLNGNGRQDAGEPGLPGVTVELLAGGVVLDVTTTDGSGNYSFPNLPTSTIFGPYQIRVTAPSGLVFTTQNSLQATATTDSDVDASGLSGNVLVLAGVVNNDVDAGLYAAITLGDRVFFDIDADGVQDAGEPGIANVPVTVTWFGPDGVVGGGDDQVFTPTTNASVLWSVTGVPPGNYSISANPLAASGFTVLTDSVDDGVLSATTPVVLTIASGATRSDVDFGYRGTGAIGDFVWHDVDGDGVQDAGEPGIPNVQVQLTWAGSDGVLSTADDAVLTTTTDANGLYTFANLPAGVFRVEVLPASLPDNATPTFDFDGTGTANAAVVTLAAGASTTDLDFGYTGNASIGDRVWFDVDGDGVQDNVLGDGFEPGIVGATVTLVFGGNDGDLATAIDNITYTTTTGANGIYTFAGLFGGDVNGANPNYRVTVTPPVGFPTGTFDATAPITDFTSTLQLAAGATNTLQDFGFRGPAAQGIGNFVWNDLNGNGRQDAGEPGLPGVTVELLSGGVVLDVTTTDGSGNYAFPNLPTSAVFGPYQIRVTAPSGLVFTTQNSLQATATTDSDVDASGLSGNVLVLAGVVNNDVDAGLYAAITLGDRVFFDIDADGVQDAGEPGIANVPVTVTWFGPDGVVGGGDDQVFTPTTNANGLWSVTGVPPGNYSISANPLAASGFTVLTDSVDDGVLSATNPVLLTIASGATRSDVDFGYRGTGAIGDRVWHDVDGDGVQDAGEPGIPNVQVQLTWAGSDGTLGTADDAVLTTTTDANGLYTFANLPAGVFRVEVLPACLPDNATPTFDFDGAGTANAATVTLAAGGATTDLDFGYTGNAVIGDRVWFDVDGDGVQDNVLGDGFEPGIVGATVTLVFGGDDGDLATAIDNITYTTTTGADGLYTFAGLFGGDVNGANPNYRVTVTPPVGFPTGTFDATAPVTDFTSTLQLANGATDSLQDFGFRGPSGQGIGDFVWNDLNGNGRQDAGEPGLPGVTVELLAGGVQLDVTTTDALGLYAFPNLPTSTIFGPYQIRVTAPSGLVFSTQASPQATATTDSDVDASGLSGNVLVLAGVVNNDTDAGLYTPVSFGDRVFFDIDADGVQDAGEPGIANVPVTVTWFGADGVPGGGDDQVFTPTTNASGLWSVTGVPPGNYSISANPLAASGFTVLTDSVDDGVLSATTPVVLTIASGATRSDVDFGYRGTGAIGDFVWHDVDGDGVQDAGEPGLPNATVQLTWAGSDGTLGTADDAVLTTTTDANGLYSFANLPAGVFRVDVLPASLPDNATPTFDFDGTGTANAATVTLAAGGATTDLDFGYTGNSVIGDRVWFDVDGDGVQDNVLGDGFEPGIVGATVTLVFGGDDGDLATAIDNITYTTTTGADGLYTFANLFGGDVNGAEPNYRVTVTPPVGFPTGTFDATAPVTDFTSTLQLAAGATNTLQDFGFRGPSGQGIGDFVWNDLNGNGRQDAGEPGLPGVTVELLAGGVVLDVTTTDGSGNYAFPNLPTSAIFGPYQIRVTAPSGLVFSTQNSLQATATTDSDVDASGLSGNVLVLAGVVNNDVDAGLYAAITLGDRVFFDIDADGVQDAGEPGIANVPVTVTWFGADGVLGGGDDQVFTPTTNANGLWSVTGVPPGNYSISANPAGVSGFTVLTDSVDDGVLSATTPVVLTIASGATRSDVDFGYRGTRAIGDFVWHDVDGDGVQDAGEPGIPNTTVQLTWAGSDGVLGTADDAVLTTTTDANGLYTFANLPAGVFRVEVIPASLPDNATPTFDFDGTGTVNAAVVTLAAGASTTDLDFGYTGNASIGDRVWFDVDGDGVQDNVLGDGFEPGIVGATVTLVFGGDDGDLATAIDNITYTTTTGADGLYTFANLFGGDVNGANPNYRVTVTPPVGFPTGTFDATAPVTDFTSTLQLAAGATNTLQDFGYRGPATQGIGNFVWNDLNGNGRLDAGEPGLPGVTVELLSGGVVLDVTTTDGSGNYAFPNLPTSAIFGPYQIRVTAPSGLVFTTQNSPQATATTDSDVDAGGLSGAVTVLAGVVNNDVDAGLYAAITLGDRVFFDIDADGVQDAGEPGIANVPVTLTWFGPNGVSGTGDDQVFTPTTNASGLWSVTGAPPGNYSISANPAGVSGFTVLTDSVDDGVLSATTPVLLTIASGATRSDVDFGYRGTGVIGDRVWHDVDGDGVQDAGEPGLPNVQVQLTWAGSDGTLGTADDAVLTTTTDANGLYTFANLPAGVFRVNVIPASLPDNATPTFDFDGTATVNAAVVTLAAGASTTDLDFGYTGNAVIGDRVWFDVDGDGVQDNVLGDGFEPGIVGATVTLVFGGDDGDLATAIDNITYTTVTGADGLYTFAGLFGGDVNGAEPNYRVTVTLPVGYPTGTFDATAPVTDFTSTLQLAAGATNTLQDFGYRGPATQGIGNFVWNDLNGNGRQDAGEPGLPGVTVELLSGGVVLDVTTTDGSGLYAFPNLPTSAIFGPYQIRVTAPSGLVFTTQSSPQATATTDSDVDASGLSGNVLVLAGVVNNDTDAGLYTPVSFGDRVFFDIDADGVQDAGEPGIANVPVTVTWFGADGVVGGGDDQVFTPTTNASGLWSVTGVPPGNYSISANPLAASGFTVFTDSVDDGVLSATTPVVLTIASGATRSDVDFGYLGTGVIGDRVWHDVDGDGVQDAGEPGLPNVQVQLTWFGSDGVLGTADDAVLTTTTDANGLYTFANLPAGVFRVEVLPASLPDNATPTFDFDGTGTANAAVVTLAAGGTTTDLDFGYTGNAVIGDRVWFDVDGDGVQDNVLGDGFEPGIVGATVTLVFGGDDGDLATAIDNITYTTTTGADGLYTFANLFGGDVNGAEPNYRVTVTPLAGYPVQSFDSTAPTNDNTSTLQLANGGTNTAQDFGFRGPSGQGIGDFVWNDLNGNGRQDTGEPGLPGVTVELLSGAVVLDVTTTDASGLYAFPNLPTSAIFGPYQIRVTAPSGLVFTTQASPQATATTDSDVDASGLSGNVLVLVDSFNNDVDAALYTPVSLGQRVWFDTDGDGTQDVGEPGIPGVAVQVTWFGPNGNQTFTTTTDANGDWTVSNLPPGDYSVTLTNTPADLVPTFDLDGTATPNTTLLSTTSGANRTDVNFGLSGTGTIGDRVWIDANGDGLQGPVALEPGLPGVSYTLTWAGIDGAIDTADDIVIATTTGGASGIYSFANVPAGSLRVTVNPATVPENMAPSFDLDGTATPGTTVLALAAGETRTDADFGYTGTASIGNRVWFDRNQDGVQDPFEPGIPGAAVQLVWSGPDGDPGTSSDNVTFTTTTDANGNYLFPGLPVVGAVQTYQATALSLPIGGLVPTFDLDSGTTAPDQTTTIALATANPARTDANFGYTGTGSLAGSAFRDDNNDGIPNGTEPGLPGVTVTLTGVDPFGNAIVDSITGLPYTATTDANGNYTFTSLVPGVYTLTETQPGNYADGLDSSGTLGGNPANDVVAGINMGPAQSGTGYNFGERGSTIGGTVFQDRNRDGTRQPGEPGISGVTIELRDPITNNLIATTTTDANGSYTFTNLPSGNYHIVEIQPPDYGDSPIGPATTRDVTLTTGGLANQDFGETLGSVSGTVYVDANGNGLFDTGEAGLPGVEVSLTGFLQVGVFTITTITDANGEFFFENLVPASYNLAETQPGGYRQGTDAAGTLGGTVGPATDSINGLTMTPGATGTSYTFGELAPTGTFVAGTVFLDANGDGLPGGLGESGIASVTIELLNSAGTVVQTVTTGPDGSYIFTNVAPGDYTVRETQPDGYGSSTPNTVTLTVPAGGTSGVNFGETLGGLSGSVYFDANRDGTRQAGEPGLPGVTVTLSGTDALGNPVNASTITDASGNYNFTGLPAGTYILTETTPAGYTDGGDSTGTAGGTLVSPDSITSIPLGSGASASGYNFGEVGVAVTGTVFRDDNKNGSLDGGEPGLPGITIRLLDPNGNVVSTTTTNPDGSYSFPNVPPGNYTLVEVQPPGYGDVPSGPFAPNSRPITVGNVPVSNQNFADALSSISGSVFIDSNGNGSRDGGESGISGVPLRLDSAGPNNIFGDADDVTGFRTTTTNANGNYTFTLLPTGVYRVVQTTQPSPFLDGPETAGPAGGDTSVNDQISNIPLAAGTDIAGYTFAELPPGPANTTFISGTVYLDTNGNGVQDAGEPGVPGVTLTLDSTVIVTDANGNYVFTGLTPGTTYTITQTQPGAYASGPENAGNVASVLVPVNGAAGVNFGETPGSIGGTVYFDRDASNGFNAGDTPLPGVTVTLLDAGGATVATTTTAADGSYTFTNLAAGTYRVIETQPANYNQGANTPGAGASITGTDELTFTMTPGLASSGNNFGERGANITGTVWYDADRDSIRDPGETTGIPNVVVTLLDGSGAVVGTATTAADGSYTFTNLPPGTYTLVQTQPPAYGSSTNNAIPISITSAGAANADFGETLATLSGNVFADTDGDGTRDAGENGISGVTVTLTGTDVDGNSVNRTTTTDANGDYTFTDLPAGTYTITETQPNAFGDGPDTVGSAGGDLAPTDSIIRVPVGAGTSSVNYAFAEATSSISGYVYRDFDLNSTRTIGGANPDTGIAGITITLTGTDSDGRAVSLTTVTDANGLYTFTGLGGGEYTIIETQPPLPTTLFNGFYDGADNLGSFSGTNFVKNQLVFALPAGLDAVEYNFGELPPADPFGFVYIDLNQNGTRNAGEAGIANVGITISGLAFAGTPFERSLVASDIPGGSLTIFTDATGRFEFSPIPPGLYTLTEAQPIGFVDGLDEDADPNGPPATVGNDVISNIVLAPFPIRGPFNFGEIRLLNPPAPLPPIEFFPPADPSKRGFLASTPTGVDTTLPVVPNFAAFNPGARPAAFASVASEEGGLVRVFDFAAGVERFRFSPFPGFTGSVRVATADVTGDGIPDIITVPGAGGGPVVKVFDGNTGAEVRSFFAFEESFRGGLRVAAADLNGDFMAELIVTPDVGGGPIVRAFDGATGAVVANFFALDENFRGGLRIAEADVNNDGTGDLLVTAGGGGGPRISIYDGAALTTTQAKLGPDFFGFAPELRSGFWISGGDVDGDGFADIVMGTGEGGSPRVVAYSGQSFSTGGGSVEIVSFFAGDPSLRSGTRVHATDLDGDGRVEVIASFGAPTFPLAYIYDPLTGLLRDAFVALPASTTGVNLG